MNNFNSHCNKKESDLPLSKRLVQELITSPLLNRERQPVRKSKNVEKSPDVNFLFDDEKPKSKTRKTEKLRKVINLTDAIRKQVVRINEDKLTSSDRTRARTERLPKWAGKLVKMPISYFVEVDTKTSTSSAKSPTTSQTTITTTHSVKEDGEEWTSERGSVNKGRASQKEFKIISFEKKLSDLSDEGKEGGGRLSSSKSLRKMSSHMRLKEQELMQLNEMPSNKKSSKDSIASTKQFLSVNSLKKTLSKFGGPLRRQISELDLKIFDDGVSDLSMVMSVLESYLELPEAVKWSACMFPGWELGEHCHSVAASIFNQGFPEPHISSSSSSDDLYESTKYSRDIIEEKLRGLESEKKEDEDKSIEGTAEKQNTKIKSKTKFKCTCHEKKNHHGKCVRKGKSKTYEKSVVPTTSKDSDASGDESLMEQSLKDGFELTKTGKSSRDSDDTCSTVTENEYDAGSQPRLPQDTKSAEAPSEKSSSSENVIKHPCNVDTCLSLNKGKAGESFTGSKQPMQPQSIVKGKSNQQHDDGNFEKGRSKLNERTHSGPQNCPQNSSTLKSGVPPEVEASFASVRPGEECVPETCDLAKKQGQQQKSSLFKHFTHSRNQNSSHIAKRREICNPKICKTIKSRSKKRFPSKANKFKGRRWERAQHNFICNCHDVYVEESDSDTGDLWSDQGFKRCRNRRYSLTLENVNKRAARKCGGHMTEGHHCNCYSCNIKEKPWNRFLKMPNVVLDIPYALTTKTMRKRARDTTKLSKKLRNKYKWSEENLYNFCTRHEVCKKPSLRKSLLQDNPFTWEWKWCHKNKVDKVVKKEIPKEEKPGRFGYFVKIKEDRVTRGEHFTNIQKIIENVVYCKWKQDVAEMKLHHFLENMPKQQTCYPVGRKFDPDRRTCYNPKLIERLAEIVKFDDDPDRRIHEFSFPPKLLKYQEPQLVGDDGTDMPEIRPVHEFAKFPTIYRDLFKDSKRDVRKLMDAILPPLQWTDKAGLWEMKVSIEPDNEETNKDIMKHLDHNETLCHAINRSFCAGRYRLYFEVFAEAIRQELIDNPERAILLARIREEFLVTMLLYDGGLEMTLVSTTHLWKDIEAETLSINEKETLEKEIEDIKTQIRAVTLATYDLEKRAEEQSQTRDYQNKDQEKLFKKTNHQLNAQYENIKAGLLYDID